MTTHVCEICAMPSHSHHDPRNLAPRCCHGCACGVTRGDPQVVARLVDDAAEDHPGFEAFVRLMRPHAYDDVKLNAAWAAFKRGWEQEEAKEKS